VLFWRMVVKESENVFSNDLSAAGFQRALRGVASRKHGTLVFMKSMLEFLDFTLEFLDYFFRF
jgi:hypothetical protein